MAINGLKPIFKGISFPYQKGAKGIPSTDTDFDIIKQDLLFLLTTRMGERVMLLDFGTNSEKLIFENTGTMLRAKITRDIVSTVAKYEPRVKIESVAIKETTTLVDVIIKYSIVNFKDEITITLSRE